MQKDFSAILSSVKIFLESKYPSIIAGLETKILVSLSGGPDSSLCLMLLLQIRCLYPNLVINSVVFNHGEKMNNYEKVILYLTHLCKTLNIKIFTINLRDQFHADKFEKPSEDFFRKARIKNILAISLRENIKICVLGHNKEDCLDTFLMRVGKGTGFWGTRSIEYDKIIFGVTFFRPLLFTPRATIELIMYNYQYFLDPTRKLDYQRNRLRRIHHILESVGIKLEGISQTISKQKHYYAMVLEVLNYNLESDFNYCKIHNFSKNKFLENMEQIKSSINNIMPFMHLSPDTIENLIKKIYNSPVATSFGCLFSYQKNKDVLIITREKEKHLRIKSLDFRDHYKKQWIIINNFEEKDWVLWDERLFVFFENFHIIGDKYQDLSFEILPFFLLESRLKLSSIKLEFLSTYPNLLQCQELATLPIVLTFLKRNLTLIGVPDIISNLKWEFIKIINFTLSKGKRFLDLKNFLP